jgi:ppGpp synthetase/RelA/SpoT-type nucleotidyltranferase
VLTAAERDHLVGYYISELREKVEPFARGVAETLRADLVTTTEICPLIFWRIKTPESLARKLEQKFGLGRDAPVTPANLNRHIQDLGGVRVLVHDRQDLEKVFDVVQRQCDEGLWKRAAGKIIVWDQDESEVRDLAGNDPYARVEVNPRGSYRSRHYVVRRESNSQVRCEIQLRTVLEEAAFEAHHRLIYRVAQNGGTPPREVKDVLGTLTQMLALSDKLLSSCYSWAEET